MTTVSDLEVAAVRAFLSDDQEERRRLHQQMDPNSQAGYAALIAGACIEAVDRRFGKDSTDADIIEWVGQVRARSEETGDTLDPVVAERVVKTVLGRDSLSDLDDSTVIQCQVMVTAAIVGEKQLDASQIDAFLSRARMIADHMLNA